MVSLRGGSYDGRLHEADPPPSTLRVHLRDGDTRWSELYLYFDARTVHVPGRGPVPVMAFVERHDEPPAG
jgi:hypothetical protein